MLQQNESLMQSNLSQLKAEKQTNTRLLKALFPVTKDFAREGHKRSP
jgi:hypothetical protein